MSQSGDTTAVFWGGDMQKNIYANKWGAIWHARSTIQIKDANLEVGEQQHQTHAAMQGRQSGLALPV